MYAPQNVNQKRQVWNDIFLFMNNNLGSYMGFGDFNIVVRKPNESLGTVFFFVKLSE